MGEGLVAVGRAHRVACVIGSRLGSRPHADGRAAVSNRRRGVRTVAIDERETAEALRLRDCDRDGASWRPDR